MRFLFVRPALCLQLPSDPASRRRPCCSASGSHHQGPQRTSTSKSPQPPPQRSRQRRLGATRHAWRTSKTRHDRIGRAQFLEGETVRQKINILVWLSTEYRGGQKEVIEASRSTGGFRSTLPRRQFDERSPGKMSEAAAAVTSRKAVASTTGFDLDGKFPVYLRVI
jgi:hypothetical protein